VKPINLLPGEYRPRRASGALSGSSYVLVGGLAALVLLAALYIVTANKVTSRENETAEAKQQTQVAQAKIASLGAYGDFATVAEQRSASVKRLAGGRFDWERLTRELAVVLPDNVWLTEVDASVSPETAAAGAAGAPGTSGAAGAPGAAGEPAVDGPSAKLAGCAKNQPDVAKLMVRLRQMHRVDDVVLKESSKSEDSAATGGTATSSATAVGTEGCGSAYSFELTVVFDQTAPTAAPAPGDGSPRVPARLGGGE
jgi:Tfp pilus assembly protein PilN